MMQTIKGTASRNVIFGGITYVLAEDIYYDAKDWAPIEPRAQVKSPEGAEIYWYFPDADGAAFLRFPSPLELGIMVTPGILHNFSPNFCAYLFQINSMFLLTLYKLCYIFKPSKGKTR